jgi:hypothetical protein
MTFRKLQEKYTQVIYSETTRKVFGLTLGAVALVFAVSGGATTLDTPTIGG